MVSPPPPFASETPPPFRIVFMGTPQFAAHILERLLAAPEGQLRVTGVVTRPDQPRKRGLKLEPSEVSLAAEKYQIPLLKPSKIRTGEFLNTLKRFEPELLIIAAYGRILPKEVLESARIMPINVHASLLPRFRGAAPVEGAILAGDDETGVTIMRVTEQMDAGPILLRRKIPIAPDETQGSLKAKLAELGASVLLEALAMLRRGELNETAQDDNCATYTSPIAKPDALIDWNADAAQIERMVRAYDPWPVARTKLGGSELLVWRARVVPHAEERDKTSVAAPSTVVSLKPELSVKCGVGTLALVEVQTAGRRRMLAADFMRGRRLALGTAFGT
jgi:methionyl-tRNA formyltransferase